MMALTRYLKLVAATVLGVSVFAGTVYAADTATSPDSSLLDLARPVYDAFAGGHYAFAAAALVILLVALLKRYAPAGGKVQLWLHTDLGGALTALVVADATAMGAALAAPGAHVTLSLLESSLLIGVGAAGGFAVIKSLIIEPLLAPLVAKMPAWLQPIFNLILKIFDKPDAVKQAEAAGAAAVAAAPAPGTAAVAGQPTQVK